PCAGGGKIGSGENEALLISIYFGRQPLGVRAGADHEEESARVHGFFAATPLILQHEVVQPGVAATVDDLGAWANADVRCALDLTDQVVGHPGAERVGSHDHGDVRCVTGQVQGRLPG